MCSIKKKNPHINRPTQFKPKLFKGQGENALKFITGLITANNNPTLSNPLITFNKVNLEWEFRR